MAENRFFVGLDLGQAQDYTALSVIEQRWNEVARRYEYDLRYLDRARGEPYPSVVKKVSAMMNSQSIVGIEPPRLILDKTGVGAPVADMFRVGPISPVEITITGGISPSAVPRGFHVPKRDLVFSLIGVFQSGRFRIADSLPLGKELIDELLNFKVKIDPKTAHDSYESWRESIHDDMVLSAAMSTWYAERRYGARAK